MESTLVSARVPRAKKERAGSVLASIGATASDLINSAYDYAIETGKLPMAERTNDEAAKESFASFVEASTLDIHWPQNTSDDYKALERDWRRSDYESLA